MEQVPSLIMPRERIVFFLDFANIERSARDRGHRVDFGHLVDYITEGRFLIDAYAYVPIDPRHEHGFDRDIEDLWLNHYFVKTKKGSIAGDTYKCDFDVEISIDAIRIAHQVKPDIIVLASGDSDYVPLIEELRNMGIRVEVASFESSASRDVVLKCSGFINLDVYIQERSDSDEIGDELHPNNPDVVDT